MTIKFKWTTEDYGITSILVISDGSSGTSFYLSPELIIELHTKIHEKLDKLKSEVYGTKKHKDDSNLIDKYLSKPTTEKKLEEKFKYALGDLKFVKQELTTQDAVLDHLESLKKVIDRLLPEPTVTTYGTNEPIDYSNIFKENK